MDGCFRLSSLVGVGLVAAFGLNARGADASFQFEALSREPYTAAYLGNGAMGVQTTPLGTTASRCFLAGIYDRTPGDVPRIASAPAWNEIDVYNGSRWLNGAASSAQIENYHQVLDMYDGVLRTSYVWVQDDRRIGIRVEEFVSRDQPNAGAVRVVITPQFSGSIKARLPLENWDPPQRYALAQMEKLDMPAQRNPWLIWYPGYVQVSGASGRHVSGGTILSLIAEPPGTPQNLGEAIAAEWTSGTAAQPHIDNQGASDELTINTKAGTPETITKFVAFATSGQTSRPDETAVAAAIAIRKQGWEALLSHHVAAWHRLWETDIVLDGDPGLQRTVHSMLFYLLGSTRADLDMSTPPMGLSTAGYYGHIFWDADTFLFPPLAILHPELAQPMVAFRSRTREAARRNARSNGFQGAMYPWEAGPDGAETTPRFAGQNAKYENHINGDVALAAWQYWLATGDREWLRHDCWPILRDTADFWISRVSYNAKQNRYEIGKVVAVNESLIGVNNDAWTNAVAKKNLELATRTAAIIGQPANPRWGEIAKSMYIPESDSALLWFPLGLPFGARETHQAIQSELKSIREGKTGAMMGTEFYPILAAELGDRQLLKQMMEPLSTAYLRPPFQVIAETPHNQNTNFLTGAGAFLQQVVFGYTGLRLTENGLEQKFHPVLPAGVEKLTLKNVTIRGKRQTLTFTSATR